MTSLKAATIAMPFLIAESSLQGVRSSAIGEMLVTLAAICVIVMVVWNLIDRARGGVPQKREVKISDELATQEDLRQAHGRIGRERIEIDTRAGLVEGRVGKLEEKQESSIESLRIEIKGDVRGVHDRVNDVLKAVSKLEGKIDK